VRAWLAEGREALLAEISRSSTRARTSQPTKAGGKGKVGTSGAGFSKSAVAEAKSRLAYLSVGADRVGVSFAGAALHAAYFDTKYETRGALLYSALKILWSTSPQVRELLGATSSRPQLRVASIGGGPGTDSAGLVWVDRHFFGYAAAAKTRRTETRRAARMQQKTNVDDVVVDEREAAVHVLLLDFEPSWKRYLPVLNGLMAPTAVLAFDSCDVRRPIFLSADYSDGDGITPCSFNGTDSSECSYYEDYTNRKLRESVDGIHLFVFSFVAHETALAVGASGWCFYKDLARGAAPGAVFLFLDVRTHSADVFEEICAAMASACVEEAGQGSISRVVTPVDSGVAAEFMVLIKAAPVPAAEGLVQ
jgi:hypothetical protein